MRIVTLYCRPECLLSQEMARTIEQVSRRRRFKLVRRNILDDAEDLEKYKDAIPLVMVDGVEIARFRLTAYALETALTE